MHPAGFFIFSLMDKKAKEHFEKAENQLKQANNELFKPKEDVVSFIVCKNSLFAIENYLKGYLTHRGFETKSDETLDHLLERCRLLDSRFNQINIDTIDCSMDHRNDKFCEDIDKVSSCFNSADSLDTFLRKQRII